MEARAVKKVKMIARLKACAEKFFKKFEEAYFVAVDELAAKQGTGRKFGNPKRIAQAKLRKEMTKCENAQESTPTHLTPRHRPTTHKHTLNIHHPPT